MNDDIEEAARALEAGYAGRKYYANLLRSLRDERDRLSEALVKYGVHDPECCNSPGINDRCSCGLLAALGGDQ